MNPMFLILLAIAMMGASGLPALFGGRRSPFGQRFAAVSLIMGSLAGLSGVGMAGVAPAPAFLETPWLLPAGSFSVSMDAVSAVFLVPVLVLPALGAIYGLGYWPQRQHPANGRKLSFAYGMLAGAMALVTIARDGILFLIAWEIMALAAFFVATTEDREPAVRQAGWVYLVATHVGTLCLVALFALWQRTTGSFSWAPLSSAAVAQHPGVATALFLLALIGFGCKAGIMPLHVWLPGAHANAPSHVSAVMSGVMLKMGVYGIVRVAGWLPVVPSWWGCLLLGVGALTALLGILFAIAQRDIKRLLAYSSIENIGIMVLGIGLALLGRTIGRADLVWLGLAGCLFHVWNHALFKGLLFLAAGAVVHATGTRDIERLGGLVKRMPRTAALFLLGAVAICALPPLNGFVSEWLLYLGFFRAAGAAGGSSWPMAGFGAVALAMTGALAAACFCKVFGAVFLGEARSPATAGAHDPDLRLTVPMAVLAAGCLLAGVLPACAVPMIDRAVQAWTGAPVLAAGAVSWCEIAPLAWISWLSALLLAAVLGVAGLLLPAVRRAMPRRAGTWDCGYARPTARMQYTGSSFGQSLTELFAWVLGPRAQRPRILALFPRVRGFEQTVPDAILDRLATPVFQSSERMLMQLRFLQQGRIQVYVVYFLAAVLVLLLLGGWVHA
ncbi:MAG: proton-conducting transporter membrane subunit [bacterium]